MGVENESDTAAGDDAGGADPAAGARPRGGSGKSARVDDATLLAELAAGEAEKVFGKPKAKENAVAKDDEKETDEDEVVDDKAEADDEEDGTDEDDDDADEDTSDDDKDKDVDESKLDAATKKKLAGAQRAEKRFREQMATDRATFTRERDQFVKEWEPRVRAAEAFEEKAKRAKYAPDVVLEALGLSTEDMEAAARVLYARSQAGSKDPKNREAAARLMREREAADKLAATEKRLAEMEGKFEATRKEAETQSAVNGYLDTVTKAIKAETPLVKKMVEKTPKKARALLHQVASELADELGEVPDPVDVIAELEKRRAKKLEEDGIDIAAAAGISSSAEGGKGGAGGGGGGGKKPARTLGKTGGGPTAARKKPATRDEEFEETRKALEAGELD